MRIREHWRWMRRSFASLPRHIRAPDTSGIPERNDLRWDVVHHQRPGADEGLGTDMDLLTNTTSKTDEGCLPDNHTTGEARTGADVCVRSDSTLVFDDRAGIDECVF